MGIRNRKKIDPFGLHKKDRKFTPLYSKSIFVYSPILRLFIFYFTLKKVCYQFDLEFPIKIFRHGATD